MDDQSWVREDLKEAHCEGSERVDREADHHGVLVGSGKSFVSFSPRYRVLLGLGQQLYESG